MPKDFQQHYWSEETETELKKLLTVAIFEDSRNLGDLTSRALVPEDAAGAATIHARQNGIIAGIQAVPTVLAAVDARLSWTPMLTDGTVLEPGMAVGVIHGPVRNLLTAERLVLNLMGRLSGIASLTRKYVDAVHGTAARIYDTRKTTLGWRLLEKYAVRCGGGCNHRTGLFDAVLIKDNHLAFGSESRLTPAAAVERAKNFVGGLSDEDMIVEVEVDTLDQLVAVLSADPDIVLLDNMPVEMLIKAVEIRNHRKRSVELEASGGVDLGTVRAIAGTGVERISVGALTHSAVSLDLGLDW